MNAERSFRLAWFGCCALLAFSCSRLPGCAGAVLGELIEVHGRGVERDFAGAVGRWQPADIGARFTLGDGIRTGEKAQVILQLNDGSQLRVLPGSQLRFRARVEDGSEHGLDVEVGEAEISVGGEDLVLRTELGLAVLHSGSRVTIAHTGAQRLRIAVELGTAQLQPPGGGLRYLAAGQNVEVGIGMAVLEPTRAEPKPAAEPAPALAATAVPAAPLEQADEPPHEPAPSEVGSATPSTAPSAAPIALGPTHTSLAVSAGDSFSVHAAKLPVNVSLEVGARCSGEAALSIGGKRTRGAGKVSAALSAGSHEYTLRCLAANGAELEPAVASGNITVLRDSGSAQLPKRAPSAQIDADGKHYTVLYQNLLPHISVDWPNAPKSTRYVVEVDSAGKPSKWSSEHSRYEFKPGALREGTHTLVMTTPNGARSPATTLEIRFDNAAPKATVSTPRDGGFAMGATVDVSGVALPGLTVTLPGGTLALDAQSRFTGSITTSAEHPDVVLKIESPRSGVHYYVRRANGG